MATVYKAFQPSLQREVALKVLRPGYAQDKEFLERFEREAIAIARLRHPHIVQVFDFEVAASGEYVLAMEFLEGGTLKERLTVAGKLLDQHEVVRIVGEVADALSYAHELGIVHRDVKPSNVMLTHRDRAVVTDFGIARILGATSHTQTGVGIGTPEYMAPEQGQGSGVDHRADIYSLGVMAYELLTGRVPYNADTPLAVVIAHIKDPLPLPSTVNPAVGPETEKVLLRALAKDPAQRYDAAIDFAEALKTAIAEDAKDATMATVFVRGATASAAVPAHPAAAPAVPARRAVAGWVPTPLARRPIALGVAGALVIAIAGGAAFAFTRGGSSAPTAGASTAPTKGTIALRGPLLFEAKLDAAGSEIQRQPGPPGRTPDPNAIRLLDGAIQFTIPEAQGFGAGVGPIPAVINWRRSFPATFFAEMDVKVAPGSQLELGWVLKQLPQASVQLAARVDDESMELRYQSHPAFGAPQGQNCPPNCPSPTGPSAGQFCPPTCPGPPAPGGQGGPPTGQPGPGQFVQPETIGTPAGISGFASGSKVTIGVAVQPQGVFTMFFNGQNVGQVTDARAAVTCLGGGCSAGVLSVDVHGQSGTLTLTGFRVYQLAAP